MQPHPIYNECTRDYSCYVELSEVVNNILSQKRSAAEIRRCPSEAKLQRKGIISVELLSLMCLPFVHCASNNSLYVLLHFLTECKRVLTRIDRAPKLQIDRVYYIIAT